MAYTFGKVQRDEPVKPSSAIIENESVGTVRLVPEKQLIFGDDIHANPVPNRTAATRDRYHLTFVGHNGSKFALNEEAMKKHLLLLGGIGTGKTNVFNFMIESLLQKQSYDDILFIFDTKGDFYDTFYSPYDPNHIVIGNNRKYRDQTACWNLFGEVEAESGIFQRDDEFTAKEIGKQLLSGRGSETQPFFELAAADLVSKVIIDF